MAGGKLVALLPAKVGDKLITHRFGSGTTGFSAPEDIGVAVCVLPGTELSFAYDVKRSRMWPWSRNIIAHKVAVHASSGTYSPEIDL